MTSRPLRPPSGLGPAGKALWGSVVAEMKDDGVVPTSLEKRYLADAAALLDAVSAMEAAMVDQPMVVLGSMRQPVAHPLLAEIRQARQAIASLLNRINLMAQDVVPASRGGRHAFTSESGRGAALARYRKG